MQPSSRAWGSCTTSCSSTASNQARRRASFHSPGAFYATWAHEQVHSTGHASRLKRDLGGAFGKPRYAREELVAELGAVLLGDRLEIGSELQSHAAYLEHWIALLQAEPQVLFQVLGEARQAVELIAPEGVVESTATGADSSPLASGAESCIIGHCQGEA